MSYSDNFDVLFENSINDVKWVFEQHEATTIIFRKGVPFRSFGDSLDGVSDFGFETRRGSLASLEIPICCAK